MDSSHIFGIYLDDEKSITSPLTDFPKVPSKWKKTNKTNDKPSTFNQSTCFYFLSFPPFSILSFLFFFFQWQMVAKTFSVRMKEVYIFNWIWENWMETWNVLKPLNYTQHNWYTTRKLWTNRTSQLFDQLLPSRCIDFYGRHLLWNWKSYDCTLWVVSFVTPIRFINRYNYFSPWSSKYRGEFSELSFQIHREKRSTVKRNRLGKIGKLSPRDWGVFSPPSLPPRARTEWLSKTCLVGTCCPSKTYTTYVFLHKE